MGKVMTELSMSLDGYIAGPHDGPDNPLGDGGTALFRWYQSGDTPFIVPSGTMTFRVSAASAALLEEMRSGLGALVTGRRTFDITNGWEGRHPSDVPIVVVTHEAPEAWVQEYVTGRGAPFTFVTEGVARAVSQPGVADQTSPLLRASSAVPAPGAPGRIRYWPPCSWGAACACSTE